MFWISLGLSFAALGAALVVGFTGKRRSLLRTLVIAVLGALCGWWIVVMVTSMYSVPGIGQVYWPFAICAVAGVLLLDARYGSFKRGARIVVTVLAVLLLISFGTVLGLSVNHVVDMDTASTPSAASTLSWQQLAANPNLPELTCIQHVTGANPTNVAAYAKLVRKGKDLRFALVVGKPKLSDDTVRRRFAREGVPYATNMKVRRLKAITVYANGCKRKVIHRLVAVSLAVPLNHSGSKMNQDEGVISQGPWKEK